MEKDKMLQILIPVAAIAAIAVVVALIVGQSAPDAATTRAGGDGGAAARPPAAGKKMSEAVAKAEGMVTAVPDATAAEWKDIGSGLKTWDIRAGEGAAIAASGAAHWHYIGWLTDGTVFDGSLKEGAEPIEFGLTQVIKGWTLGLAGMKPGGIRRLYIPSALAYGKQDKGTIPPDSDLIFEVKLVRISR